jgi:hypothetical protein
MYDILYSYQPPTRGGERGVGPAVSQSVNSVFQLSDIYASFLAIRILDKDLLWQINRGSGKDEDRGP